MNPIAEFEGLLDAGRADTESLGRLRTVLDAIQSGIDPLAHAKRAKESEAQSGARSLAEAKGLWQAVRDADKASKWGKSEALRRALDALLDEAREAESWPGLLPIADDGGEPDPVPVLCDPATGAGVLSKREVGILAGRGGSGKSYLTLQWGIAAAVGRVLGEADPEFRGVDSGGYRAVPGRWMFMGYEDSRWRVARRFSSATREPDLLRAFDKARNAGRNPLEACRECRSLYLRGKPLFGVPAGSHKDVMPARLKAWDRAWADAESFGPDVVVIDPAGSAYLAAGNDIATVRSFVDALYERAEALGCAVLVVCHPSKQGRGKDAGGGNPGNVSGSTAWVDASRAVLMLDLDGGGDVPGVEGPIYRLWPDKANHFTAKPRYLVRATYDKGKGFAGFECVSSQVESARAKAKAKPSASEADASSGAKPSGNGQSDPKTTELLAGMGGAS